MGTWNSKCRSMTRLDGKTVVITGCNTGIGKECVQDFYLRGAKVIMACRNLEKALEAQLDIQQTFQNQPNRGAIQLVQLDLSRLQSVRECAKRITSQVNKIDILLNNAGIMACPYMRTEDDFEMQFGTNYLGHFLLTLLLLPKIVKSDSQPARIVNVSSILHIPGKIHFDDLNYTKRDYSPLMAYYQAKLANILFSKELARRLEEAGITNVHTYALHPGIIKTNLGRHFDDSLFPGGTSFFLHYASLLKTPQQGAQTSIFCCVSAECANETGLYYQECHKAWCTSNARNKQDAKRLWNESLQLVGLNKDCCIGPANLVMTKSMI